jgi:prophage tail gpP-like protein
MVWPDPQETVVLTIDGQEYRDWETVQVRHSLYEHPYYTARFTCSEGLPIAKNWGAMRIIPGQWCTVMLGGILAVSGWVYSRQVFVDARRHYVEITAGSDAMPAAYSSIVTKNSEFKKITAEQFIKNVTGGIGISSKTVGGSLPSTQFPRISIAPGTSVLEGIEMVLRQLGNYPLTSSPQGGLVVVAGHTSGEDTIFEGTLGWPAMLEGREIIYNPGMAQGLYSVSQGESKDNRWGTKNTHEPFKADPFNFPFVGGKAPLVTVLEIPTINPDQFLAGRLNAEKELQGGDEITVTVTVRGWMRPAGGLWSIEQKVKVVAPMLVMDGSISLIPKSITFSQDNNGGTTTQLVLCNEKAISKFGILNVS